MYHPASGTWPGRSRLPVSRPLRLALAVVLRKSLSQPANTRLHAHYHSTHEEEISHRHILDGSMLARSQLEAGPELIEIVKLFRALSRIREEPQTGFLLWP
eukprot:2137484-Rhodomonas_salina.1